MTPRYEILASRTRREETIERSRFVTTLAPVDSIDAARAFVALVSAEFHDASHNCWAFAIGPPGSTANVGMSDAGEPHGTAGRPMLDVLVGSGVGDVAVVVSRWFGGVKLGKGGLVRAYGDSVLHALAAAPRIEKIDWVEVTLRYDYDKHRSVTHQHPNVGAQVIDEVFGERVEQKLRVPREALESASAAWRDAARGRIEIVV